ncbi:MAG: LysM peptidoglycan-binding domain-containing protein [Verrucomicrobiota bacterium]
MKPQTLPVKRRPAPKGIFKRLSAVTGNNRKQRVAATASPDMEIEDSSSKISRALTIIFLVHIVAIGLIFVHKNFLDGRAPDESKTAKSGNAEDFATVPAPPRANLPLLSTGEKAFMVSQGDNYERIATKLGVDEGDLRLTNKHAEIIPGIMLKIPPKRIVAQDPPEVTAIRERSAAEPDLGMMENVDIANAPRAQVVKSKIAYPAEAPVATASGKSYVVQNGDSVWRIANKFKVNQDALMKANGISDARKMKVGMSLVIP